jgi:hypothetical protein
MKKKMQMGGSAESNKFTIPSKNKISIPKKASKDSSAESNVFTIPSRNKISIPKKTMKMGGTMKKAKDGSAFAKLAPPFDKATYADKIAGATKGKAKSGAKMKKAMMGASMMDAPMMKKGGSMKKCKYGCK